MAKKYIDADHLKAEIEKRKKSLRVGICGEAFTRKQKIEMLVASEELDRFNRIIDSLQQEQPAETDEVKWHNDEDYDETDKGRFVLGSVGIGYNGYYIPYSDLLKLPKEENT